MHAEVELPASVRRVRRLRRRERGDSRRCDYRSPPEAQEVQKYLLHRLMAPVVVTRVCRPAAESVLNEVGPDDVVTVRARRLGGDLCEAIDTEKCADSDAEVGILEPLPRVQARRV
jgi:hypothetical protein